MEIEVSGRDTKVPTEQEAIRAKCFHPTGTFVEFPIEDVETSIPARFEKIVHQHPERIAVKIGSQHITYGELNKAANRLAHAILYKLGGDLQPIALFIEKGISRVIANMAILKAGQIAIDANPFAPRERVRHIFEDARPSLILTDLSSKSLAQDWANEKTTVLSIEDIRSNLSEGNLKLSISPNSYSEISYTSGSTGQSKGVVKTHRQRLIEIMNFTNLCHICPEDRIGNFGLSSLGKQLFYALL